MSISDAKPPQDRRRHGRNAWSFPVRVRAGDAIAEAVCRDVSAQGMQLILSHPVSEGVTVSLSFELPGGVGPRTVAARVVRAQRNHEDSRVLWPHRAGVCLDHADAALAALADEPILR